MNKVLKFLIMMIVFGLTIFVFAVLEKYIIQTSLSGCNECPVGIFCDCVSYTVFGNVINPPYATFVEFTYIVLSYILLPLSAALIFCKLVSSERCRN